MVPFVKKSRQTGQNLLTRPNDWGEMTGYFFSSFFAWALRSREELSDGGRRERVWEGWLRREEGLEEGEGVGDAEEKADESKLDVDREENVEELGT